MGIRLSSLVNVPRQVMHRLAESHTPCTLYGTAGAALLCLALIAACDRAAPGRDAPDTTGAARGAAAGSASMPPLRQAPPIACRTAALALTRVSMDAGAGQRDVTYALTNRDTAACTLRGYPRVILLGADDRPVPGVRTESAPGNYFDSASAPAVVTLAPGEQATFAIAFTGIRATERPCARAARVVVVPPGGTPAQGGADTGDAPAAQSATARRLSIASSLVICADRRVRVTPLRSARDAVAGIYGATLPAADAPARVVTLRLAPDGTAVLTTAFAGRDTLPAERGRWSVRDSLLSVRLAGERAALVYVVRGANLTPLSWDTTRYGGAGLPLERQP